MITDELRFLKAGTHEKIRWLKERMKAVTATPQDKPIFILGNQKSGTSAICGLLGESVGKDYLIDFVGGWSPHIERVINQEIPIKKFVMNNAWAFSHAIIKEPNLTFIAPQLISHFPHSEFIFVVRDPFNNIRSILNRLGISGRSTTLDSSIRMNKTWNSILTGRDLGIVSNNPIEVLAQRCNLCNQIYLSNSNDFNLFSYEEFMDAKKLSIESLARRLELSVENNIERLVNVNFQPRGDNTKDIVDFFGEENYTIIDRICSGNWNQIKNGKVKY